MRWNGCAILGSNAMLISQFQADGSHVNPASTVLLCPLCGQNDSAYETLDAAKYKIDLDEGGTQSTQLRFWNKWMEKCLAIGSRVVETQTQAHINSLKTLFKSCLGRLLCSCVADGSTI